MKLRSLIGALLVATTLGISSLGAASALGASSVGPASADAVTVLKNGKPATKGTCPICGNSVVVF